MHVFAIVSLSIFLGAPPALAHAFLKEAVPPVGSTVPSAPAEIVISFTESVEPGFSRIEVRDAAGARVDLGDVRKVRGDDTKLAVRLGKLRPGSYNVSWHVTATDTHKTQGKFSFSVAN